MQAITSFSLGLAEPEMVPKEKMDKNLSSYLKVSGHERLYTRTQRLLRRPGTRSDPADHRSLDEHVRKEKRVWLTHTQVNVAAGGLSTWTTVLFVVWPTVRFPPCAPRS